MGGRPYSVVGSVCTNSDHESRSNPDHGAGSLKCCCFAFWAAMGGKLPSISDLSAACSFQDVLAVVCPDLDTDADVDEEEVFDTETDADLDPD